MLVVIRSAWCLLLVAAVEVVVDAASQHFDAVSMNDEEFTYFRPASRVKRETVKDTEKAKLTQTDRADFVKAHNEFRSIASPTAEGMPFMTWNATLENYAQRWALNCEFEHGQPDDKMSRMGQNLWMGNGGYNAANSVNAWDKEKHDYNYNAISCDKVCGHYTQVVWAKSTEVGCGIAYCEDVPGKSKPQWLIVCNYLKPGNLKGARPYESGTSCSNCPEGYSKCDNKLCRKDPMCGDLTCENGGTMDTSTCLCDCGDEDAGPWCGEHPAAGKGSSIVRGSLFLLSALVVCAFI